MTIGAIVLAAGAARRFGADKRQARLPDGRRMLDATLARYAEVFDPVRVVLRAGRDEALAAELGGDSRCVMAADAALGMGHSLAAAAHACTGWDAAAIALADMPWVTVTSLRVLRAAMAARMRRDPRQPWIIRPLTPDGPGHPVLFARALFPHLAALRGDAGARAVIHAHGVRCIDVALGDPGLVRDADTPQALAASTMARPAAAS